jgi:hypothetical protein
VLRVCADLRLIFSTHPRLGAPIPYLPSAAASHTRRFHRSLRMPLRRGGCSAPLTRCVGEARRTRASNDDA